MGVIIYSFNLNTSPKTSLGMLECDIVILQNYMLVFCNKKGALFVLGPVCMCVYIYIKTLILIKRCHLFFP